MLVKRSLSTSMAATRMYEAAARPAGLNASVLRPLALATLLAIFHIYVVVTPLDETPRVEHWSLYKAQRLGYVFAAWGLCKRLSHKAT